MKVGFSDQTFTLIPALQYLYGALAVLIWYNQSQSAFSMT